MRQVFNTMTGMWEIHINDAQLDQDNFKAEGDVPTRIQLKEKYGWMSPSEFYSLSPEQRGAEQGKIPAIVLDLNNTPIEETATSEPTDYVWINTLSNWCYVDFTQDQGEWRKKTAYGRAKDNAIKFVTNMKDYLVDVGKGLWDTITSFDWKNPLDYFTYPWKLIGAWTWAGVQLALVIEGVSVGTIFVFSATAVQAAIYGTPDIYKLSECGIDDEDRVDSNSYPEICGITKVWDGYRKRWVSLKKLVNYWNQYMYADYGNMCMRVVQCSFTDPSTELLLDGVVAGTQMSWEEKVTTWLQGLCITADELDEGNNSIIGVCLDIFRSYKKQEITWETALTRVAGTIRYSKNMVRMVKENFRQRFLEQTGIDPISFGEIFEQNPVEKRIMWGCNNGDDQTRSQWTLHEVWGMYVPLHQDDCRLVYLDNTTAQTLIRANSYQKYHFRDRGNIDTIYTGTPVLTRFSDGRMWLALWLRWSGLGYAKLDKSKWSVHTSSIVAQWSESDMKQHSKIMHQMFEKHDDYGFDEWCINSNYGVEYKYFTLNEEVPGEIADKGASHLINTKTDIFTTQMDDTVTAELTFEMQTPTIERSKNDTMTTVEKWK